LRAQLEDVGAALGDGDRVTQIVENLLTNAVKFTPAGGLVQVSLARERGSARITVADTGQGIAPDFLPHVFERFRQADTGTTREHGGLGIGLTIAKKLAEMHGGTIEAHSEGAGRGAAFVVCLPLLAPHAKRSATPARGFTMALPELDGLRVLIVDDEPDMRALLASALELCRAEPRAVCSAAEALAELESAPPDVLISDIGMAGDDGYALIRKVRALPESAGGRVPALALTAYARDSDREAALRAGFDRHMAKPIDPMDLLAAVAKLARRDQ
jgi:CheY-like chemotaxis protein/anti-sigma regulatory factor (Ser/Thr protein kinase)